MLEHFKYPHPLRKESFWISAVFLAAAVTFFFPAFFLGRVPTAIDIVPTQWPIFRKPGDTGPWLPRNNHMLDIAIVFEPWYVLGRDALQAGEFPLWNPWNGCGVPLMANTQSAVFYPGTWLVYLLGLRWGLVLLYSLRLLTTGLFTYCYLRTIGSNTVVALLGALGFMFSGSVVGWLYWPLASVFFLLPFSLLVIEKYLILAYTPSRFCIAYALGWAIAFFGGHPETLLHISVFGVFYSVLRSLALGRKRSFLNFGTLMTAHLMGLALAAVQFLPAIEYLRNSFEWVARGTWFPFALNWRAIIAFFVPDFYGNPGNIPVSYYAPFMNRVLGPPFVGNYYEYTGGYVGITLLLLGVGGAVTLWRKDPYVPFFAVSLLMVGAIVYKAPVLHSAVTHLPLFRQAVHTRLTFLMGFCLVVLAARYLQALHTSTQPSIKGLVVVALLTVPAMLLLWWANLTVLARLKDLPHPLPTIVRSQGTLLAVTASLEILTLGAVHLLKSGRPLWGFLLLFGLVGTQTMAHGWLYEPQLPASRVEELRSIPPVFADIRRLSDADPMPWRTTAIGRRPWGDFFGFKMTSLYPANLNAPYGIFDLRNYDAMQVGRYRRLLAKVALGYLFHWTDLWNVRPDFLDFVGVKYVVADFDLNVEAPGHWALVKQYDGYALWTNRRVMPRAFLAPAVIWVQTPEKAFARVTAPDFDWHGPVVLEQRGTRGFPPGEYPGSPMGGMVRFLTYRPHWVRLEVTTDRPAFLVLTDVLYPGWKAFVDGHRSEIWPANYAFRAVYVGVGRHEVEFRYKPESFLWGTAISGSMLGGLLVAFLFGRRSSRTVR